MPSAQGRSRQRRPDGGGPRGRRGYDPDERQRRALEAQAAAAEASREILDRMAARRDDAWRRAADGNRKRSLITLCTPFGLGLVLMVLGLLSPLLLAVGAVVLVGWAIVAALSWRAALSGSWLRVEGVSAREAVALGALSEAAAARYEDVCESLCSALGLRLPELRVIVDSAPNAVSAGLRPGECRIVVTTGLLASLERIELEGVLAHELSHLKRADTLSGGLSVALLHGGRMPLPGAGALATWLEGPHREIEADLAAVRVTRYPPGLLSPLERIAGGPSTRPTSVPARLLGDSASQWLAPLGEDQPAALGRFALADRVAVLREL